MDSGLRDEWHRVESLISENFNYNSPKDSDSELQCSYDEDMASFLFQYLDEDAIIVIPREKVAVIMFETE